MTIAVRRWEDPTTWNAFVESIPYAHFQQSWEWGELASAFGGHAIRLAATRGDTIVGAMQVFGHSIGGTHRKHFYVPRGPVVFEPSIQVIGPLLEAAWAEGRASNAVGLKLEPNASHCDSDWKNTFSALGLHPTYPPSQPRSSWMLDISPDEDLLLAQMKQKTRYNIRLAAKRGVQTVEGDCGDLDAFYDLYQETAGRDDFFIQPKEFYRSMFDLFAATGNFCMLLARRGDETIAAVTLIRLGNTCWYVNGASAAEHRNLMPTYLLQWEAIRWAKEQDCTLYDFRAIPDVLREGQDMYGVYRFKEGFSGFPFTALHTYSVAYEHGLHGLWQAYLSSRFALTNWSRHRRGLPLRQYA